VFKSKWDELPVVDINTPAEDVLEILRENDHIWVVSDMKKKTLLGVITEKDFLDILAPTKLSGFVFGMPNVQSLGLGNVEKAGDIMTGKTISCNNITKIGEVIEKMRQYRVRRLPIVDGKILVGEVTLQRVICKYHDALNYIDVTR